MNTDKAISILTALSQGTGDDLSALDEQERSAALEMAKNALRKMADAPVVEVAVEWNSNSFLIPDAPTRRKVEILDGARVALVQLPPGARR